MQTLGTVGSVWGDRFRVEELVGHGGMGHICRARDLTTGVQVALKLLPIARRREAEVRFLREAELLCRLQHPGIVQYLAHGTTAQGEHFLAMEWLEGEDLATRLRHTPLSVQETIALVDRTADALAYLHEHDIVHRDIKPSNLYLPSRQPGLVKLIDLGIAQATAAAHRLTHSGVVIGTPEYLSPEQAHGNRILTSTSDLFSLGCVMYECLAGQPPFAADHLMAVLARVLFEDPPSLETVRPGLPAGIIQIVEKLLAKSPGQRFQSAHRLRVAIAELGPVSKLIAAPQTPLTPPPPPLFGHDEQSLICVVLATQRIGPGDAAERAPESPHALPTDDRDALDRALTGLGIAAHFLASGDLLATVSQSESATDLAKRAARGALLIQSTWPGARVVMATGRGRMQGQTMLGEVVSRAGKLLDADPTGQTAPGASGVQLDPLSARLLEGSFAIHTPASGTLVLQEAREAESERLLLGKPSPFVGRDAEQVLLRTEWNVCVEESETRAILLVAPPGMGKSRLKREFIGQLEREGTAFTLLHGIGDPLTAGAPFEILRQAILRLCRLGGNEPPAEQEERLRQRIGRHVAEPERDRVFRFLAILCRLPVGDGGSPLVHAAREDPKIMRLQIGLALDDWLMAEAQVAPILLVLDDLQWGDASTIELLELTLQSRLPLLVLAFGRPGIREQFPKLWGGQRVRQMTLHSLGRKACEKLAHQVLGDAFDKAEAGRAIDNSTGNALFLEEQIRALSEQRSADRSDTILAMMQARIGWQDASLRRLIRAAAIFGTAFWQGGLALLLDRPEADLDLQRGLRDLLEKEFIVVRRNSRYAAEREYGFRHPLVWEAAYSLLTEEDLRIGHGRAAQYLERMGEQDAILLAEHIRQGDDATRAVPYYVTAAVQAYERNDLPETLRRVDLGIAAGAQGDELGLLLTLRCVAGLWTGNLRQSVDSGLAALDLLPAGNRWWCNVMGHLFIGVAQEPAADQLTRLIERFRVAPLRSEAVTAYAAAANWVVTMYSLIGDRATAALALQRLQRMLSETTPDPSVRPHIEGFLRSGQLYFVRAFGADPYHAVALGQEAAQRLSLVSDRHAAGSTYLGLCSLYAELGDWQAGRRLLQSFSPSPQREGISILVATLTYSALALACSEDPADWEQIQAEAEQALAGSFSPAFSGMAHTALARLYLKKGQPERAATEAAQGAELCRAMPPYALDAQVQQIRALLALGRPADARHLAEEAIQTFERLPGLSYGEVELRYIVARAREADGDAAGAATQYARACDALYLRAVKIPDPIARERYLLRVPHHAWLHTYRQRGTHPSPSASRA